MVGLALQAIADRRWQEHRLQQGLIYSLAGLVAYSVNDPRKMPKFEKCFPDPSQKKQPQSADEIHALMVSWVETMEAMTGAQDG